MDGKVPSMAGARPVAPVEAGAPGSGVEPGSCGASGPFGNRFTRHGTRPLCLFVVLSSGVALTGGALALALATPWLWGASALALVLGGFVLSFFRNPARVGSGGEEVVLSPADGKVLEVVRVDDEEFIGGPATRISIFLSVFDCHVNRAPVTGVVGYLRHRPGTFLNALRREARETNECQALGLRMEDGTRVLVRQIAGLIARRIVCPVAEGQRLERGFDYGMIRFGSQTELSIPDRPGAVFTPAVSAGDRVAAGETAVGEWREPRAPGAAGSEAHAAPGRSGVSP